MIYQKLLKKASDSLNLPEEVINVAYKSYWQFIRSTIQNLPLKEVSSEEQFSKLRVSFNLPSLGKLFCSWDKIQKVRRKLEYTKNIKK